MYLFTKQKETHRLKQQVYGYQGKQVGEIDWNFGNVMYTLLYLE